MDLKQARRALMLSLAGGLAVVAVLVFALIMQFNLWHSLQGNVAVTEQQLAQLEERLQRLHLLQQGEEEMRQQLELLIEMLPAEVTEQELLREIHRAAWASGCQVHEIRFGEVVQHERYAEIPLTLALEGGFGELVRWLEQLRGAPKIYRVQELSIQSSSGNGLLRADVQMSSFYINN
ncbi:MAG TPA: type 4a pilus biogenesis protein PilO [Clostridia bacterium]|nr:type 4a pilus biogenesis protein PilO [Clostridia bacterium]